MKTNKILFAFCLLLLFVKEIKAQSFEPLKEITTGNQNCLDTGVDMLGCSRRYYIHIDSLLNVNYNQLSSKLNATEKEALKEEQLTWLKKRDNYFRQQNAKFQRKFEEGEWGSDMAMITYSEQADFVKKRVLELLKQTCQ